MVKTFAAYYRCHGKILFFIILGSCAIAGLELLFPMIVRNILDNALPRLDSDELLQWSVALLVLYLINCAITYFVQYYGHVMGVEIENSLRKDLFFHLQQMSFRFFDNNKTGQLLARLTSDIAEISELAFRGPNDLIVCTISMVGTIVLLFWLNPELGFVIGALLIIKAIHTVIVNLKMKQSFRYFRNSFGDVTAKAEESLSGMRLIKAFAREKAEYEAFSKVSSIYVEAKKKSFKILAYFIGSMNFFTNITNLAIMAIGGYMVINGKMMLSDLVAFFLYVGLFIKPLMRLLAFSEIYQRGMAGYYRFYEVMRQQPEIVDSPDSEECDAITGNIQFEHVTFGYDEKNIILQDLNLTVVPGETVAFVGETGAGKTTIANLLLRFYEPLKGRILINGKDIRSYTQSSLRKQIGLVQQDVFLFSESVKFNIIYGNDSASMEEVVAAARAASAEKFIEELPSGYDTEIGERGVKLSGGQKQRLAIARIFLKNPPIVVLDEATSALDSKTEQQIQSALDKLTEGRTTFIIAHRLSTIKNADRIIVLKNGKIVESGTHEDLLAKRGFYYELYYVA